jgi:hypothetical protein
MNFIKKNYLVIIILVISLGIVKTDWFKSLLISHSTQPISKYYEPILTPIAGGFIYLPSKIDLHSVDIPESNVVQEGEMTAGHSLDGFHFSSAEMKMTFDEYRIDAGLDETINNVLGGYYKATDIRFSESNKSSEVRGCSCRTEYDCKRYVEGKCIIKKKSCDFRAYMCWNGPEKKITSIICFLNEYEDSNYILDKVMGSAILYY